MGGVDRGYTGCVSGIDTNNTSPPSPDMNGTALEHIRCMSGGGVSQRRQCSTIHDLLRAMCSAVMGRR